jgi:hypothetical protein
MINMTYLSKTRLILLLFICIIFSGCSGFVYRGTQEDMFQNSSVLNLNLPLYVEFFGMIFNSLLSLHIIRLLIMSFNAGKSKVPIKIEVELKLWQIFELLIMTSLLGLFAIIFDAYKSAYLYDVFFMGQISILVLTSLKNVTTAENIMDNITGRKNGSILGKFIHNHFMSKLLGYKSIKDEDNG